MRILRTTIQASELVPNRPATIRLPEDAVILSAHARNEGVAIFFRSAVPVGFETSALHVPKRILVAGTNVEVDDRSISTGRFLGTFTVVGSNPGQYGELHVFEVE